MLLVNLSRWKQEILQQLLLCTPLLMYRTAQLLQAWFAVNAANALYPCHQAAATTTTTAQHTATAAELLMHPNPLCALLQCAASRVLLLLLADTNTATALLRLML
jgi:hypothetical protein